MRTVQFYEGNAQGEMKQRLREVVPQRIYTYQEMSLLARASGFDLQAAYGELHLTTSIRDEDAPRMVLVLERRQS